MGHPCPASDECASHYNKRHTHNKRHTRQDPAQVRLPDQRRAGPVSVPTPMSRRSCARTEEQPVTEKILITPTDLSSSANGRATVLIDTRDPAAYAAGHLPGAVNIHDRKNCC